MRSHAAWTGLCVCLLIKHRSSRWSRHHRSSLTLTTSPPFVVGVDVDYDNEDDDATYTGYFKVAIATLLNELFPHLATEALSPDELATTIEEDHGVWIWV